jgi:hypothetical protein
MNDDKHDEHGPRAASEAANMEVDVPSASGNTSKAAASTPMTKVALTPFNNSPSTPRGIELVERARKLTPHLIAPMGSTCISTSATRVLQPSRVRTFIQGRTRPGPVLTEIL